MDCLKCRGACCETFWLRLGDVPAPSADVRRWVLLHGKTSAGFVEFTCWCRELTDEGLCRIYDERPAVCRDARPGAADCLEAVRARRTPAEYREIRDAEDPETLEGAVGGELSGWGPLSADGAASTVSAAWLSEPGRSRGLL